MVKGGVDTDVLIPFTGFLRCIGFNDVDQICFVLGIEQFLTPDCRILQHAVDVARVSVIGSTGGGREDRTPRVTFGTGSITGSGTGSQSCRQRDSDVFQERCFVELEDRCRQTTAHLVSHLR